MESNENVVPEKFTPVILNKNLVRIITGLNEMSSIDFEIFKVNYAIARSINNLIVAKAAYDKSVQSLQKKYVKTDEHGALVSIDSKYVFNNDADKQGYRDAIEKLNEMVVDVKVYCMKISEIKDVKGVKASAIANCNELIIHDLED